ncbi:MAG: acyl-CoA dehydrogenase family protein [Mycobacteriales bacterium]
MNAVFGAEHEAFRQSFRGWLDREAVPHTAEWNAAGIVPREMFLEAGKHGFVGFEIPEDLGGAGIRDFRFNAVITQEIVRAGTIAVGIGIGLHNDIVVPYLTSLCSSEQAQRWLPQVASGEAITAIAMTEPGAGSDLAGIRTTAVRDGNDYVVNGSKTFITNGINADLVVTAVRTSESRHGGLSLLVLERGMPGFERGRNLAKIGQHGQDTAELSFTDVRVPAANLLGEEGKGFTYLVANLAQERMGIALFAQTMAEEALRHTLAYVDQRKAFGQSIGSFQVSRHRLAELATEIDVSASYVDRCLGQLLVDELSHVAAAKAKWWTTEMLGRVVDGCLQLHGGYGYMEEYPISQLYVDARISRIYGGTTEIMKEIISKDLGLS